MQIPIDVVNATTKAVLEIFAGFLAAVFLFIVGLVVLVKYID